MIFPTPSSAKPTLHGGLFFDLAEAEEEDNSFSEFYLKVLKNSILWALRENF